MSGSKPVYHKPDGSVTTKQDFDSHCPNIGKTVDKKFPQQQRTQQAHVNLPSHRGEYE
jgi:hypothetical protein